MNEQANPNHEAESILASTPYLELVQKGRWAFARRPNRIRIVAIVAVTENDKLLLVEQHRVPVGGSVVELPAGLAGDTDDPDEPLVQAAARELLEETGYAADSWTELATVTSSAGITDEQVTLFRARGLKRISAGGGVEGEQITVHEIPLRELESWLHEQAAKGKMIDSRVFAALHWAAS